MPTNRSTPAKSPASGAAKRTRKPARTRLTLRRSDAPKQARAALPAAAAKAAGPVVKWAGGKTRLLDELAARTPDRYRRYFEPFMGGAALYFRLMPKFAVLSDCNADLVNMYRCVAWNVEAVIRRLESHRKTHGEEHFYSVRDKWNTPGVLAADVDRAAAFIYLNKTCYNGLWRVNSKGKFNVPMGRYQDPPICDKSGLRAASRVLQSADLTVAHYAAAVAKAGAGDFVYFDPPYHPVSDTANFTSYTQMSFGPDDQEQLAEVARDLDRRGARVLLSNSDTAFIRKLYKGFRIDTVDCARAINSKASARGPQRELLISNG